MRKAAHLLISTVLTFFMCWAGPVGAETITALYHVSVLQRQALWTELTPIEPFEQQFALGMSFEATPLATCSGFHPDCVTYGRVSFSTVPIPSEFTPPVPAVYVSSSSGTLHGPVRSENLELIAEQYATAHEGHLIANFNFNDRFPVGGRWSTRTTSLENWVFDPARPPVFRPETFPMHLSAPGDNLLNFRYFDTLTEWRGGSSGYVEGSFRYQGTATLAEFEVVPEPATIALIGTGLALVAARRRKRRKAAGHAGWPVLITDFSWSQSGKAESLIVAKGHSVFN